MLTIRLADESDVERLVALHGEAAPGHYVGDWGRPEWMRQECAVSFRWMVKDEEKACFVADEDGVLLGYVTCVVATHPIESVIGEVHQPVLSRDGEGNGTAQALVEEAVRFCRAKEARTVRALTRNPTCLGHDDEERKAAAFWESMGWRPALRTFEPVDPTQEGETPPDALLVSLLLTQAVHQGLYDFELAHSAGGIAVRSEVQGEVPLEQFLGHLRSYRSDLGGEQVAWEQVRQRLCHMAEAGSKPGQRTFRLEIGVFPPPRDNVEVIVSVAAEEQDVLRLHIEP